MSKMMKNKNKEIVYQRNVQLWFDYNSNVRIGLISHIEINLYKAGETKVLSIKKFSQIDYLADFLLWF